MAIRFTLSAAIIFLLCSLSFRGADAEQLPLWEAGAGLAAIDFPAYRGSDERQSYLLPIPFLNYNGQILKVSRERVRALFFKYERMELDVSVNGSVPVNSSSNRARSGMPNLDATLELGPSLNLSLFQTPSEDETLELRMPWRPVFASNFSSVKEVGWLFQPQINLDVRNISGMSDWKLGLLAGPIFADTRYHQYFYGVDAQYATASRPAYQARGGYAGWQFISALSKRFPDYWVGGFVKFDNLNGSVIADSPLVRSKMNASAGFAISWVLDRSQTMVEVDDDE